MLSTLQTLLKGRRRRRLSQAEPPSRRTRAVVRGSLAAIVLVATMVLFPIQSRIEPPEYLEGTIAAEEIIAPIRFDVPKGAGDLEHERALASESVLPIFTRTGSGSATTTRVDRLVQVRRDPWLMARFQDSLGVRFSISTQRMLALPDTGRVMLAELRGVLQRATAEGLVADTDEELLNFKPRLRLRTQAGEQAIQSFQLYDSRKLIEAATDRGRELFGDVGGAALAELAQILAQPNVRYDHHATELGRDAARETVSPIRRSVEEGERIVDAHERITGEHVVILSALEDALRDRTAGRGTGSWLLPLLGRILLVASILALLSVFLRVSRPRVWRDLSLCTLLAALTLLTLGLAAIIARTQALDPYLIPVAFIAILVTLLVDDLVALTLVALWSVLIGAVAGWGLQAALVGVVGGMTAVYSVRGVTHRMEVYRSILLIALANVVVVVGVVLVGPGERWSDLLRDMMWAAAGAGIYTATAMLVLPIFERGFGLTTNISLLELSDLNRPIFKRMMIEANGTYHHSMVLGSLAEAAAEAVGANPLLARVGAYYHDIGKIAKSSYFGENMGKGVKNPHERLTPTMSSLILESHVSEGLELAREIGLPHQVAAFIPEHQGTTLMQYFYNKAAEQDPEVDENDYRYPGPKPQSKETAIVMLADAAEATVRSLDEQSPKRIRAVLDRILEMRAADGQLDECGLTVRDLSRIREAFTHVLTGVFHGRVKYQWQKDGGEARLAGEEPERVIHPELETGLGTRDLPQPYADLPRETGQKARG